MNKEILKSELEVAFIENTGENNLMNKGAFIKIVKPYTDALNKANDENLSLAEKNKAMISLIIQYVAINKELMKSNGTVNKKISDMLFDTTIKAKKTLNLI